MIGATLFSGGGGVEALLQEHIEFVRAVEFDPQIAAVYAQNIGPHVQVADVRHVDYGTWPRLDYLHASPVCKNFSTAKTNGTEGDRIQGLTPRLHHQLAERRASIQRRSARRHRTGNDDHGTAAPARVVGRRRQQDGYG